DVGAVSLQRMEADAVSVAQSAVAVTGTLDMAQSLRWTNGTAEVDDQFIRIRSGACSTDCGADDVYRIRAFDTTYVIPRFNDAGSQVTVLLLQNPTDYAVAGEVD